MFVEINIAKFHTCVSINYIHDSLTVTVSNYPAIKVMSTIDIWIYWFVIL